MARKTKPRWEFLWWKADEFLDDRKMQRRYYVAPTIEKACDKMLRFIQSRDFEVLLDYEARAMHVGRYNGEKHEETFPDLSSLKHPISEYVA